MRVYSWNSTFFSLPLFSSLTIRKGSRTGNSGNNLEFSVLTLRTYVPWYNPVSYKKTTFEIFNQNKFFWTKKNEFSRRKRKTKQRLSKNGSGTNQTSLHCCQLRHKGSKLQEIAVRFQRAGTKRDSEGKCCCCCWKEARHLGQNIQEWAAFQESSHLLSSKFTSKIFFTFFIILKINFRMLSENRE